MNPVTAAINNTFKRLLPTLDHLHRRTVPHLTRADKTFGRMLPAAVALAVVAFGLVSYFGFARLGWDVIVEGVGIVLGLVAVLAIYESLEQERNIQFFEGENVILKSDTAKTYAVVATIGDHSVPLSPFKATIYLTNLGVLAEPTGSGEAAIFMPIDRITEFVPFREGIRVRYVDVKHMFVEVVIFVEDRGMWMQALEDATAKKQF